MSTARTDYWIVAAILVMTIALSAALSAAQKSESPEVIYQRAVQKDQVDGDRKAAIELYKQVIAAPGVSSARKAEAQAHLSSLLAPAESAERTICVDCGGDLAPVSISEDGRIMAFGSRRTPKSGLFIRDIASGKDTQLLSNRVLSPVLSRDLKQIVYVSYEDPPPYELRVIENKVGAQPRGLNSNPEFNILIPAAWARDGKSVLVVAHMKLDQTWKFGWVSVSDGTFRELKSLGWRFQCCGPIGLPSLSRDGRFIAYAAKVFDIPPRERPPSNDTHIFVLAADGSSEIELVKGASVNESPVWTPDGKNLLFVSDRGSSNFGLWSVSMSDGALREVKRDTGEIHSFGITDSGSYIYSPAPNAVARFAVSELGNAKATSPEIIRGNGPVWSPDGKRIAFHRWKNDASFSPTVPGDTALVVYSLDTKEEEKYMPNTGVAADQVSWSRNGNFLFQFMWNSKDDRSLHRLDLKTREFKRTQPDVRNDPAAISYDGNTIFQVEPADATAAGPCSLKRIVAIEVNSGQTKTVAILPDPQAVILAPDDSTLYLEPCDEVVPVRPFVRPDYPFSSDIEPVSRHIVAVNILTGGQREVFAVKSPEMLSGNLALAADGRSLAEIIEPSFAFYYGKFSQSESAKLIRVAATGNDSQELFRLSGARLRGPKWSADGTAVTVRTPPNGLRRIPVNGGAVEVVQPPESGQSPDGLHAIKLQDVPSPGEIRALDGALSMRVK